MPKSVKKRKCHSKNKTTRIHKSNRNKNKHKEGNKFKICWDPNIISPVFFGYPLK